MTGSFFGSPLVSAVGAKTNLSYKLLPACIWRYEQLRFLTALSVFLFPGSALLSGQSLLNLFNPQSQVEYILVFPWDSYLIKNTGTVLRSQVIKLFY